jgi:glutamyl-tRNA synthetase
MLRFAPSPTGDMHIESLRIAIINYLYAQQKGEEFIVRIEDMDKANTLPGKDEEILMILEKFALPHSQLYHQSENLHIHQTLAIRLLQEQKAFICLCSTPQCNKECENSTAIDLDKLKENQTPFTIRLKKPQENILFRDLLRGQITTTPDEVDRVVILKADGIPSELFATACDDILNGVTTIVRSVKHLKNTPKQKHIKTVLGFDETTSYLHLPTMQSKEQISIKSLLEEGFLPDAIINYLILVGNLCPKEIFTMPEAIEWFDIEKSSQDAIEFDIDKLRYINREHLKSMEDKKLSSLFGFADADIGKLAKLYLDESSTINELKEKIEPIFAKKDLSGKWGKEMQLLQKIILEAPMIYEYDIFENYLSKQSGLKGDNLITPLGLLMTGSNNTVNLKKLYVYTKSYITEIVT